MKKYIPQLLAAVIFLAGLAVFLYPTVSNLWNEHLNAGLIYDYVAEQEAIPQDEYLQLLEDARNYNQNLHDEAKLEELGLQYNSLLNPTGNGVMGYLEIPKISVELVIYHSLDDIILQNGIGHMEGTALPVGGENTHCVLAGHSGLPSAKLLTNLDQLSIGDSFSIHIAGEELSYMVDDISVVLPHEVERLAVQNGRDLVTLVTCTPYGINSHRLLVRGSRMAEDEIVKGHRLYLSDEVTMINPLYLVPVGLIILLLLSLVNSMLQRIRGHKHEAKLQTDKKQNTE